MVPDTEPNLYPLYSLDLLFLNLAAEFAEVKELIPDFPTPPPAVFTDLFVGTVYPLELPGLIMDLRPF